MSAAILIVGIFAFGVIEYLLGGIHTLTVVRGRPLAAFAFTLLVIVTWYVTIRLAMSQDSEPKIAAYAVGCAVGAAPAARHARKKAASD